MLGPLIQRFSRPSYRWNKDRADSLGPLPGLLAGACILPRSALLYTRIELAEIPARQRPEALKLELEQSAPFDQVSGWVIWNQGQASVWYWPSDLQQRIEAELPGRSQGLQWLPETALWPALPSAAWRWVQSPDSELVLLQYQHPQHGLYEKRYPGPISQAEASAWLSRHGLGTDAAPEPSAPPSPGRVRGNPLEKPESSLETRLLPGAALLLSFLLLAFGVATLRASIEADAARERANHLQVEVNDVLSQRQQVGSMQADNAVLAAYQPAAQLATAASLAELLDIHGGRLLRWGYRNGQLELSWLPEGPMPDTTELISSLEEHPAFSHVQAQNRGDTVVELSLKINAQALSEANAAGAIEVTADE